MGMRTSSGLAFFGFALDIPAWSFLAMSRGVGVGLGFLLPQITKALFFFWGGPCVVSDSRKKDLSGGGNLGIRRRAYGIVVNWNFFLFRKHIPILIFFFLPPPPPPKKTAKKTPTVLAIQIRCFLFL